MELPPEPPEGLLRHAVIFSAGDGFPREFYPLAVDAYVRDIARHGEPRFQVLGVRCDWLDRDGYIRRALLLDPEHDRLVERDQVPALPPHSAQFLALGRREQSLHRTLSGFLRCPQVNPGTMAERADDKAATLAEWADLGLEVPCTRRLSPGQAAAAARFIAMFGDSVVKPNYATEGLGVSLLAAHSASAGALSRALDCAWRAGPALIQQRRDGLLFRASDTGQLQTLALRLNLVFDGRRHRLASGYAQLGADAAHPASCGRGGRIVPLAAALAHLLPRHAPSRVVPAPDEAFWTGLAQQAERAASAFGTLLLVGLDVVLDLDAAGRIVPVFLEANPRPAGLCHSRLLARNGCPGPDDSPGVGLQLWDALEALCSYPPAAGPPGQDRHRSE